MRKYLTINKETINAGCAAWHKNEEEAIHHALSIASTNDVIFVLGVIGMTNSIARIESSFRPIEEE